MKGRSAEDVHRVAYDIMMKGMGFGGTFSAMWNGGVARVPANGTMPSEPRFFSKAQLDKMYPRVKPSKGRRNETWEGSKVENGKVYDPSGVQIKPGEPWQMGHAPRHKFSDAQQRAAEQAWPGDMWKAYQKDPGIYRPERARTNLSHRFEDEWYDLPSALY